MADRLADAWNERDAAAALALFADDAVATAPGSRWQGKGELAGFLERMWDPTYTARVNRGVTTSRCASGDDVQWRFTYPDTGAAGAADLVVHGGLIQLIFWRVTLAGSASGTAVPPAPVAWRELSGVPLGVGCLIVLGVLRQRRRSDPAGHSRQHGQLLRALRDARLARLGTPPGNR